MRNRIIIGVAAFYLLISSGMFVCFIRCGSESLIKLFTFVPSHEKNDHHQGNSKDCSGREDCSCCDKHGNYIVKENIKPEIKASVPGSLLVMYLEKTAFPQTSATPYFHSPVLRSGHPPSADTSIPIFIRVRSLLI